MGENVNELILRTKNGDAKAFSALCEQYEPLIRAQTARPLPFVYCDDDREELRQVALIAFYNAVCSYDLSVGGVELGLYAKICINNALVSHLRHRSAREPEFVSAEVLEAQQESGEDPAALVLEQEALLTLRNRIKRALSPYEHRVWSLYTAGYSAKQVGAALGKSARSVENAVYRIRAKLRRALQDKNC